MAARSRLCVPGDVAKRCEQKTPGTGEVNCSPKPWISLKTIVFSFSLRFFTFCLSNSNTMFSAVLINPGFVAQIISFSKYQYISRCPWSEVYMILAFSPPPHPPSHFLTSGYLLQSHDNSNCFWFPLKLSRVDCPCKWLLTYDDLIVKLIKFRGSISTYTCSGSLSTWFLVGLESATVSATPHKSSYFYSANIKSMFYCRWRQTFCPCLVFLVDISAGQAGLIKSRMM